MILAAFSSERQSRFYGILLPIMAAMFATFGWLNSAGNPWPMIVTAAFLGVVFYFKDTLMERWGSGGPGTTLMNIAVLLIIFQAMVSAVNAAAIFGSMTVGSSANTFGAIDASSEITKISNMGGATDPLVAVATFLTQVLPAALMAIVSVLIGLACFSAVLLAIWPGLGDSGLVLALLGVFQLIIYIVYIKAFYDIARGNAWALDF
jgi:hypothetical protein